MVRSARESTAPSSQSWLLSVSRLSDVWTGKGVNHVGEDFDAELVIRPLFSGAGFLLWFRALGSDRTVFHEEVSLIGFDASGRQAMASVNTNVPYLQSFEAEAVEAGLGDKFQVLHGDFKNTGVFRQRIALENAGGNTLRYNFAWALPGEEEVVSRSSATLSPSSDLPGEAKI